MWFKSQFRSREILNDTEETLVRRSFAAFSSAWRSVRCWRCAHPAYVHGVAWAAKLTQASVGYQNSPKGDQSCSNCALFMAPLSCKTVEDPISANGWCKIWAKKAA